MGLPGERITELRKAHGMNQIEMAEQLGLSQNQVSRYETGATNPNPQTLAKIAKLLNTTSDYLLGLTDSPEPLPSRLSRTQAEMLQLMSTQPESAQAKFVEVVRLLVALRDEDA